MEEGNNDEFLAGAVCTVGPLDEMDDLAKPKQKSKIYSARGFVFRKSEFVDSAITSRNFLKSHILISFH